MFDQEFIRLALLAGSAIAITSGVVGYFVVLRAQVFAGDAFGHVAFTGVLGAAALGLDLRVGLFVATIGAALILAALGSRAQADDPTIGTFFAWVLGLGALFLDLFNKGVDGGNGTVASRALFGSIFGLDSGSAVTATLMSLGIVVAMVVIARPLLFASLDSRLASARGLPVSALGFVFLVLIGLDAGVTAQAVGALLLLGLLAAPAGAAHRLTANPYLGMALSALFALASVWIGVILSYAIPTLPPSSAVISVAAGFYLLAFIATAVPRPGRRAAGARRQAPV